MPHPAINARRDAVASYQAYNYCRPVGRIRRSCRIRQSMPDATLSRLIRPTTIADL
ncbi:hypothetical protein ACLB1Q_20520 [Escherichia coli]